ncbi:MAG: hypothetical protein RMA76_40100 [Deltaproteobacteria bacterium]
MRRFAPVLFLAAAACGSSDEAMLFNRLELPISLEVRAPQEQLVGGCDKAFAERFCEDQYEVIGVVDVEALSERELIISDATSGDRCTNILWLRLVRLDEVGPVDDAGTLINLPAFVEVERGAGVIHTVAFPQATVRIDEVGGMDVNQSGPPPACL